MEIEGLVLEGMLGAKPLMHQREGNDSGRSRW